MKKMLVIAFLIVALAGGCARREDNMPGLSPLAVEFTAGSTQTVNFGYLPRLANLNQRTFSAWVYPTAADIGSIIGLMDGNDAGSRILFVSGAIWYIKAIHPTGQPTVIQSNIWKTTETITLDTWHLVTVTQDVTTTPATTPVIYLDATPATLTNSSPVAGTNVNEVSNWLEIGNMTTPSTEGNLPFPGRIFDGRIYNTILTQANVTALYNSGTPSMSASTGKENYKVGGKHRTNLLFHPFAVRTGELADYVNQNINGLKLFDAQYLYVGSVLGDVTGRAAPVRSDRGATLKEDDYYLLLETGGRIMLDGVEWN